jgi:hypothetical protein
LANKKIQVEIVGEASNYIRELKTAEGSTSKFGGTLGKLKVAAIGAAVGGVALMADFLKDSVKAAEAAQVAHARLETAFKAAGLDAEAYSKQIDTAEASMRRLGFTDVDTMNSLGSLTAATHNVNAAIRDMSTAADLARFKHLDLEQATKMLTMAMTGSQRAVKQLGITISPVTAAVDALKASNVDLSTAAGKAELAQAKLQDKLATGQEVIQRTSELVKGQGQAYSATAAGGMARFHAQLEHLKETLGTLVLPILAKFLGRAADIADKLDTTLSPAIRTVNEALDRLGKNRIVQLLFLPLEEQILIAKAEFWLLDHVAGVVTSSFHGLQAAGKAVAGFFSGVFNTVINTARHLLALLEQALNAVASAARNLASALSSIHVPHISLPHVPHVGIHNIPGFQAGGIVTRPTFAMVGEAGPEAIVPLRRGGFGGREIHVHVGTVIGTNLNQAARELTEPILRELYRHQSRNSTLGFT